MRQRCSRRGSKGLKYSSCCPWNWLSVRDQRSVTSQLDHKVVNCILVRYRAPASDVSSVILCGKLPLELPHVFLTFHGNQTLCRRSIASLASATPYQPQHWMYYITSTRKERVWSPCVQGFVAIPQEWNSS